MGLGNFHSKTFSKQHECVHWSLGELMCVVSFHWAWRTMRLWQKLGSAVPVFFFILSLIERFLSLKNFFLLWRTTFPYLKYFCLNWASRDRDSLIQKLGALILTKQTIFLSTKLWNYVISRFLKDYRGSVSNVSSARCVVYVQDHWVVTWGNVT